jgi:predicted transcriptional regulator
MDIIRDHAIRFDPEITYEEDCDFNVRYIEYVNTVAALGEIMYRYRQSDETLSKAYRKDTFRFLASGFNKRVKLLEKNGMVVSHQVTSTMGPMRAMYAPTSEFTLVIDMRNRMFVTNIIEEDEAGVQEEIPKTENLDSARQEIAQIDREIEALERERSALVRKREQLIYSAMSKLGGDMTYGHRDLTYQLLNRPSEPTEDVIQDMDGGRGNIRKKLAEIDNAIRQ